jgi:hypothetical protein
MAKHTPRAKAAAHRGKKAAKDKVCKDCGEKQCDAEQPKDNATKRVAATVFAEASASGPQSEFDATAAVIHNRVGNKGFGNPSSTDGVLDHTYVGRDGVRRPEFNAVGDPKYNRAMNGNINAADCPSYKKAIAAANKLRDEGVPADYKDYLFSGAANGVKNPGDGTQVGGSVFGPKGFRY